MSTPNFIYFTDLHLRLTSPKLRTDDIFEAQLKKLEFITKLSKDLNSEFILSGGDFGDSWDWKVSTITTVGNLIKESKILTIVGNHDVPGRNPSLYQSTGIGLLEWAGALEILTNNLHQHSRKSDCTFTTRGSFHIVPFHSDTKLTDKLINNKLDLDKLVPTDKLRVGVVHAPVGDEATEFCKGHKDLEIKGLDICLFGDIHTGWIPYKSPTGCTLINPGSLTRLTKADMDRKPKVVVIYADGTFREVEVPHKPAAKVFNIAKIQKDQDEVGKAFLAAVARKQVATSINPKEFVQQIGSKAKYSQASIDLLKEEIQ